MAACALGGSIGCRMANILLTERFGALRIIRSGVLDPEPISGTPDVFVSGQGPDGLLYVLTDTTDFPAEKGAQAGTLLRIDQF